MSTSPINPLSADSEERPPVVPMSPKLYAAISGRWRPPRKQSRRWRERFHPESLSATPSDSVFDHLRRNVYLSPCRLGELAEQLEQAGVWQVGELHQLSELRFRQLAARVMPGVLRDRLINLRYTCVD